MLEFYRGKAEKVAILRELSRPGIAINGGTCGPPREQPLAGAPSRGGDARQQHVQSGLDVAPLEGGCVERVMEHQPVG